MAPNRKAEFVNSVNLNAETDFPYLVLEVIDDQSYPRNPGFQIMHWHEDLQFIYVMEGSIEVRTLDEWLKLKKGEGVFINKNVVHSVNRLDACHYKSFIFPDYFLRFYFGGPAENLVISLVENRDVPLYGFVPGRPWCDHVLSILKKLSLLEESGSGFYAYEVLVSLTSLWLEMRKNISLPSGKKENTVSRRMQRFLAFIEKHYAEEISLDRLAASGNVSKSECLRCFKLSMQTTPYKYLLEYRLSRAAILLQETDDSIGEIASRTGFHQASYFGKCFREKTGFSPREYRNKEQIKG